MGILIAGLFSAPIIQAGGTAEAWGFSPDTTLYLGAGLGAAQQKSFNDGTSLAGKVFGGIRYRSIGAELGYLQTGTAGNEAAMPRDPDLKSQLVGLSASAMTYLPLNIRTELFGKLGGIYWDQDNTNRVDLTGVTTTSDSTGLSPLLGIGAQYRLYQNMNLRAEWEHIFSTGEDASESDVDVLSLGISMSTL